jgi:hypothetical protein
MSPGGLADLVKMGVLRGVCGLDVGFMKNTVLTR